jgi:hypothetical protein
MPECRPPLSRAVNGRLSMVEPRCRGRLRTGAASFHQAFHQGGEHETLDGFADAGDVFHRGGDSARAAGAWSAGLGLLPAGVTEQPWETYEREQLLRRLNRNDEARPLSEKLRAMAYRSTS